MHRYQARVTWNRAGATFSDNRYSRAHQWIFDGGVSVAASASPSIIANSLKAEVVIELPV